MTASAALLGIWTHILCPVPGGFNHFHKPAEGIALFNLGNLRPHPVSGNGIRHKNHHAAASSHAAGAAGLLPADALPHVAHIFNCQFNNHSFFHVILSLHLRVAPIPGRIHHRLCPSQPLGNLSDTPQPVVHTGLGKRRRKNPAQLLYSQLRMLQPGKGNLLQLRRK